MSKKVLNREQIRQEVQQRLKAGPFTLTGLAEIAVPMPKSHSLDVQARNWDMEEFGNTGYGGYVRKVVEEARKAFFLSDAAERDEMLGESFAHS
jgi:phosphoketolase